MGNVARNIDSAFPSAMGRYAPLACIGKGGMAEVFLAMARGPAGIHKLAVLKRLRNQDASHHLAMFLDEARLSARLNHPNIVHTYEVGEADGHYFIAMEYLEGHALRALPPQLRARGMTVSEALVASIAVHVLKGLHYAHELTDFDGAPLGIVHRDVSPHNLFVTYGGDVKLLDFGIAKATLNSAHTEVGMLKGKVRYMAPEQICETKVDRRADIFALGIVVWELLAGRPLFEGHPVTILSRIMNDDAPPLRSVQPSIAPELEAIVRRALQRDRTLRYATADQMQADLERFLRGREDASSTKALARLMSDLFAEKRDDIRARIRACLAGMPVLDETASAPPPSKPSSSMPLLEGSDSKTPPPLCMSDAVPSSTETSIVPPRRVRTRLQSLLLAATLGAAVVAFGAALPRGQTREAAPSVAGVMGAAAAKAGSRAKIALEPDAERLVLTLPADPTPASRPASSAGAPARSPIRRPATHPAPAASASSVAAPRVSPGLASDADSP